MSSNFEGLKSSEAPMSEVAQLAKRLESLGIDSAETEAVLQEAVLLFGDGRPEHEVEEIVNNFYQTEADKIADAEAEADSRAA